MPNYQFKILAFICTLLWANMLWAQAPNDCFNSIPVCENGTLNQNSNGPGMDDFANANNQNGCLLAGEHQSVWLYVEISHTVPANSTFGFTITPNSSGDDYDFAIFGPNKLCDNLGQPIRCSYAGSNCASCPQTGVGNGAMDVFEGASGDGFVSELIVQPGDFFYILVDNFVASSSGFDITFSGSATLQCDKCVSNAGEAIVSNNIGNTGILTPKANSVPEHYILCNGDGLTLTNDGINILPPAVLGETSEIGWAIYSSLPSMEPNPNDAGFTDALYAQNSLSTVNSAGANSDLPNGNGNTIWVMPVTLDDGDENGNPNAQIGIDNNGDTCYDYGNPIQITYLNPIQYNISDLCSGPNVTITGGYPEFFNSTYTLFNLSPGTAFFSNNNPSHNGTTVIGGLNNGESYSFTITDTNGCNINVGGTYNNTETPPDALANNNGPICLGDSVILLGSTTDNSSNLIYNWSGPNNFSANTGNTAHLPQSAGTFTYTFTVERNGCVSIPVSSDVNVIDKPFIDALPIVISCSGSIDLSTLGYTGQGLSGAEFHYFASDAITELNSPIVTEEGSYWVQAIQRDGTFECDFYREVIVEFGTMQTQIIQVIDVRCHGGNDGEIEVEATGGLAPYQYNWNNTTANSKHVIGLSAGVHSVVITDARGCEDTLMAAVIDPDSLLININPIQPSCNGLSDGSLTASAVGGSSPYTYVWNNTQTGATLNNIPAGFYSVSVTDDNGCNETQSIQLIEPDPILAHDSIEQPTCGNSDGSISLSPSGGSGTYLYSWSHNVLETSNSVNSLAAGTYEVTVTSTDGCNETFTFNLSNVEIPVMLDSLSPAHCGQNDGYISVFVDTVGGPYVYSWSPNVTNTDSFAASLSPGMYSVQVSDGSCTATLSIEVIEQAAPELQHYTLMNESCANSNNGSIHLDTLFGNAPFTYNWSHNVNLNSPNANGLNAGTYSVDVIDAFGCLSTFNFTIEIEGKLNIAIDKLIGVSCQNANNGEISVYTVPNNNVQYSWSHNPANTSGDENNLSPGSYHFTAIDTNGCIADTFIVVDVDNTPLQVAIEVSDVSDCGLMDGSITLNPVGGAAPFTFVWSHNPFVTGNSSNNLSAGIYQITITDANGCEHEQNVIVNQENTPLIIVLDTMIQTTYCEEIGALHHTVSGGTPPYTHEWSHNGGLDTSDASGLGAGSYILTVTDINGCFASLTTEVTLIDLAPEPIQFESGNAACGQNDGFIRITNPVGNYNYNWSHDVTLTGPLAENLTPGLYTITIDSFGTNCEEVNVNISQSTGPQISTLSIRNESCFGNDGEIHLAVTGNQGAIDVVWSHDTSITTLFANGLSTGNYTIIVSDTTGCVDSLTVNVNQNSAPNLSVQRVDNITCFDNPGFIRVAATGGSGAYTYVWSHNSNLNSNSADDLRKGNYSVVVFDAFGCSDTVYAFVDSVESPVLNIDNIRQPGCGRNDGRIEVSAIGGAGSLNYMWQPNVNQTPTIADGLGVGQYIIQVTDENGCFDVDTINLETAPPADVSILSQTDPACNDSVGTLALQVNGFGPFTYDWSFNDTLTLSYSDSVPLGNNYVYVTDSNNCITRFDFDINNPGLLLAEIDTIINVPCGQTNAEISVVVSGNVGLPIYKWNHDSSNFTTTASNLQPGLYTFTAEDALGCRDVLNIELPDYSDPDLSLDTIIDETCERSNGFISTLAHNDASPYTWLWSHDSTLNSRNATGLDTGIYILQVTDVNGCFARDTFSVKGFFNPVIALSKLVPPVCGNNLGQLAVMGSGGNGFLNYSWLNRTETTTQIANLSPGNYSAIVTDSIGCTDTLTLNLNEIPNPTILVDSLAMPKCTNGNGAIVVSSVDFAQQRINSGNVLSNYVRKDGKIIYQDNYFSENSFPFSNNINIANTTDDELYWRMRTIALGDSTLNYSIPVSNDSFKVILHFAETELTFGQEGNRVFDIEIETSVVESNFDILNEFGPKIKAEKSYYSVVTDNELNLTLRAVAGQPIISYIELIPLNIAPVLNINWVHDATNNTYQAINLNAGNYSVTISDQYNCSNSDSILLNSQQSFKMLIDSLGDANCMQNDAYARAKTQKIDYYQINSGGNMMVTLENDTFSGDGLFVGGNSSFNGAGVANTAIPNLYKFGRYGDIQYNLPIANGTYFLMLHFNETQYNNVSNRVFYVDIEGKTRLNEFDVLAETTKNTALVKQLPITILDGVLNIEFIGITNQAMVQGIEVFGIDSPSNVSFSWSHDGTLTSNEVFNLAPGSYSVTANDDLGCSETVNFDIENIASHQLQIDSLTHPVCGKPNGVIEIIPAPLSYKYLWNHDSTLNHFMASDLAVGIYTIIATDTITGCSDTISAALVEAAYNEPQLSVEYNIEPAQCFGQTGSIGMQTSLGTPDYLYTWNHDSTITGPVVNNLKRASYFVSVEDVRGCTDTMTVTLADPTLPFIIEDSLRDNYCADDLGYIEVLISSGEPPYTIEWLHDANEKNRFIDSLSPGFYEVNVTDKNNCSDTIGFLVENLEPLIISANTYNVECNTLGSIKVMVDGDSIQYMWAHTSEESDTLSGLGSGWYYLTITDLYGCMASDSFYIDGVNVPLISVASIVNDSLCVGSSGAASFNVNGGFAPYVFSWSHDGTNTSDSAINLDGGDYIFTVSDNNGCSNNHPFVIEESSMPTIEVQSTTQPICGIPNGSITINALANFEISWSHDDNNDSTKAENLAAGTYTIIAYNNVSGCADTAVVVLTEASFTPPTLVLESSSNPRKCLNELGSISVSAFNGYPNFNYTWNYDSTNTTTQANNLERGIYTVIVSDTKGCSDTLTATLSDTTLPLVVLDTLGNAHCGDSTGFIGVSLSSGVAPYTFEWLHDASIDTTFIDGLQANTYEIAISDANSCRDTIGFEIIDEAPEIINSTVYNLLCDELGSIAIVAEGNNIGYTWQHTVLNTDSVFGLDTGNYYVTVTDEYGCAVSDSFYVSGNFNAVLTLVNFADDSSCVSQSGRAQFNVSGGEMPYNLSGRSS